MEHVESKADVLKKPPLHQKRRTLTAKMHEGSKRAKRGVGDGVVAVRRSERLAAKLRVLVDSHDHKQQMKRARQRKKRVIKNSSEQPL